MTTLRDLPTALQRQIFSYLSEPPSICSLEETCTSLKAVIQEYHVWNGLYRGRWTTSNSTRYCHPQLQDDTIYTKDDYRRRHSLDVTTLECLNQLSPDSSERDNLVRSITLVMSYQRDALDVCWKAWKQHKQNDGSTANSDDVNDNDFGLDAQTSDQNWRILASLCLLRSIHCSAVLDDIRELCTGDNPFVRDDPDSELEEYVIVSSRMFFNLETCSADTTTHWIRLQLNEMAEQVRQQLPNYQSANDSVNEQTKEKLDILTTVFFDHLNFTGNTDNYYDFDNSMIHKALERRTGIPMTLACLYKFLARRIGIHVDIIGLPGHIVISIPTLSGYLDVFRKGTRLLTREDCERIVNSYGHAMVPEYLQPLTPSQVFRRILNNCGNCLAQTFPPNASKRMAIEAMRAVLINPTHEQVQDCRRWFSQILWGSHSRALLREMSRW